MESRIITLKKNQVQGVLDHLHKEDVLSTEDYDHCASRQTTVEKCVTLLKALKDKGGGLEALCASVAASEVQDQDRDQEGVRGILFLDVMDIYQEYVGIMSEKGTSISELSDEAEQVKKEMNVKPEDLPKISEDSQETEQVKKETNIEPEELPKISEDNQVSEMQHLYPDMEKAPRCYRHRGVYNPNCLLVARSDEFSRIETGIQTCLQKLHADLVKSSMKQMEVED